MFFFTSDHHFGHENIIKYCNRPFNSSKEMDEEMIRRWNEVVSHDDIVYHLGDFTLSDIRKFSNVVRRLNGTINIIPGSHDFYWWKSPLPDEFIGKVYKLHPLVTIEIAPVPIILCHYAMRVWDRSHYDSIHLFGHSHGNLKEVSPNSMDVGVDVWNFYPLTLDKILDKFCED